MPEALAAYEAARRPILEKLVAGANGSAEWYEHFAEHMRLKPVDFAMSYITRSGRVDLERLRKLSPRFVERYERERNALDQRPGRHKRDMKDNRISVSRQKGPFP